jgi:hypothetical protein
VLVHDLSDEEEAFISDEAKTILNFQPPPFWEEIARQDPCSEACRMFLGRYRARFTKATDDDACAALRELSSRMLPALQALATEQRDLALSYKRDDEAFDERVARGIAFRAAARAIDDGTAGELGMAALEVGATTMPYVGEAMDVAVIADPDSAWWQKAISGVSLGVNVVFAGVLPNAGGFFRAGKRVAKLEEAAARTVEREPAQAARRAGQRRAAPSLNSQFLPKLQQEGKLYLQAGAADANKLNHVFGKAQHNLDGLVNALGSEERAYRAIENATSALLKRKGVVTGRFQESVIIRGEQITVRGMVVNGAVKIGTAYK